MFTEKGVQTADRGQRYKIHFDECVCLNFVLLADSTLNDIFIRKPFLYLPPKFPSRFPVVLFRLLLFSGSPPAAEDILTANRVVTKLLLSCDDP